MVQTDLEKFCREAALNLSLRHALFDLIEAIDLGGDPPWLRSASDGRPLAPALLKLFKRRIGISPSELPAAELERLIKIACRTLFETAPCSVRRAVSVDHSAATNDAKVERRGKDLVRIRQNKSAVVREHYLAGAVGFVHRAENCSSSAQTDLTPGRRRSRQARRRAHRNEAVMSY